MPQQKRIPVNRKNMEIVFRHFGFKKLENAKLKKYDSYLGPRSTQTYYLGERSVLRSPTGYVKDAVNLTEAASILLNKPEMEHLFV